MKLGDRVTVLSGQHAGRRGTVLFPAGENPLIDRYLGLGSGDVRVALDGEDGQGARGGRGGIPINIATSDLELELQ